MIVIMGEIHERKHSWYQVLFGKGGWPLQFEMVQGWGRILQVSHHQNNDYTISDCIFICIRNLFLNYNCYNEEVEFYRLVRIIIYQTNISPPPLKLTASLQVPTVEQPEPHSDLWRSWHQGWCEPTSSLTLTSSLSHTWWWLSYMKWHQGWCEST